MAVTLIDAIELLQQNPTLPSLTIALPLPRSPEGQVPRIAQLGLLLTSGKCPFQTSITISSEITLREKALLILLNILKNPLVPAGLAIRIQCDNLAGKIDLLSGFIASGEYPDDFKLDLSQAGLAPEEIDALKSTLKSDPSLPSITLLLGDRNVLVQKRMSTLASLATSVITNALDTGKTLLFRGSPLTIFLSDTTLNLTRQDDPSANPLLPFDLIPPRSPMVYAMRRRTGWNTTPLWNTPEVNNLFFTHWEKILRGLSRLARVGTPLREKLLTLSRQKDVFRFQNTLQKLLGDPIHGPTLQQLEMTSQLLSLQNTATQQLKVQPPLPNTQSWEEKNTPLTQSSSGRASPIFALPLPKRKRTSTSSPTLFFTPIVSPTTLSKKLRASSLPLPNDSETPLPESPNNRAPSPLRKG